MKLSFATQSDDVRLASAFALQYDKAEYNTPTMSTIFWLIIGVAFLIIEMLSLSFVLLFFGFAALIVAAATWLGFHHLVGEILLFAGLGIVGLALFRSRLRETIKAKSIFSGDITKVVTVATMVPIEGETTVEYQGSQWRATNVGPTTLVAGQKAVIVSVRGVVLQISAMPRE